MYSRNQGYASRMPLIVCGILALYGGEQRVRTGGDS
jgi:hypothetical protein